MPGDKCTSTGRVAPLGGGRGRRTGGGREVDGCRTEGGGKRDDEQASRNGWTFDYGNIECGNEMFIRCGFEGETGGAREQGQGSDER